MKKLSLRALRVNEGMTREEVAEKIEMSTPGYVSLEQRDGAGGSVDYIKRILKLYDVKFEDLRLSELSETKKEERMAKL